MGGEGSTCFIRLAARAVCKKFVDAQRSVADAELRLVAEEPAVVASFT